MNSNKSFDKEKAHQLANDYARATGMECLLLTDDGGVHQHAMDTFCQGLCYQKDAQIARNCFSNHRFHSLQTRANGEPVTYYCPLGLIHWSAPIVINGQVRASFIGGHAFLRKAKQSITDLVNLTKDHRAVFSKNPELKSTLLAAPVVDDAKLESLKNVLTLMARAVSDESYILPVKQNVLENTNGLGKDAGESWKALEIAISDNDFGPDTIGLIDDVAMSIRSSEENIAEYKAMLTSLILAICDRFTDKMGERYLTSHCLSSLQEMEFIKDTEELAQWAKRHLRDLLNEGKYLPDARHADMIYTALDYIEQNYNKRISLTDIADHVHFSAPYFSKVFKREMNITFTRYLTRVRIEESKKLLTDPAIPLAKIPAQVGFEEQSYFTKVFRANVGISPGRYRDQVMSNREELPNN